MVLINKPLNYNYEWERIQNANLKYPILYWKEKKKIVGIFIVLILIVVLIILYFSLSRAEIQLKTKSQETKINFSVQIKENVENNDFLETNILNGRILEIAFLLRLA